MSDFKFSVQDIVSLTKSDDAVLNQIHKFPSGDPGNPSALSTSASKLGYSDAPDLLSVGQTMMGIPIWGNQDQILAYQETAFQHLTGGALIGEYRQDPTGNSINASQWNKATGTAGLSGYGFNVGAIVPPDVLATAQQTAAELGPLSSDELKMLHMDTGTSGGESGDGGNNPLVPADVMATDAYKHTDAHGPAVSAFVQVALGRKGISLYQQSSQRGYNNTDPNHRIFDCSGLVWWALNEVCQTARDFPGDSGSQYRFCQAHGTALPTVDMGMRTFGALLYRGPGEHVAISMGDGTVMEASTSHAPPDQQVNVHNAKGRSWTQASLIPELNYTPQANGAGGGGVSGAQSGVNATSFVGHADNENAPNVVQARVKWADAFLKACGFPLVRNNYISIVAWQDGENTPARYNPLATVNKHAGSTDYNSNGGTPVQNYAQPQDGIDENKRALLTAHARGYDAIVRDLQAGADPHQTMSDVANSIWGTRDGGLKRVDATTLNLASIRLPL